MGSEVSPLRIEAAPWNGFFKVISHDCLRPAFPDIGHTLTRRRAGADSRNHRARYGRSRPSDNLRRSGHSA